MSIVIGIYIYKFIYGLYTDELVADTNTLVGISVRFYRKTIQNESIYTFKIV